MGQFHSYANSFQAVARLELVSIKKMLELLGHPEEGLRFLHVAGTNGKGSVCAFLQSILTEAGYRCGKYISPNLVSVCERISVDGEEISQKEMEELLSKMEDAARKTEEAIGSYPTQFEIWTAAAFCYFKEKQCDYVVLETGLGGTRDATNAIPKSAADIITRIAMDHMGYLGNTLSEIAEAKAGIIKNTLVTLEQEPEAMEVLERVCREKGHKMLVTGNVLVHEPVGMCECIDYAGMERLLLGIPGYHQIENAALAIETARLLRVDEPAIRAGLAKAKNPGRLERLSENLIFDGAHNPNGMESLLFSLNRYFPTKPVQFIMACMGDKDIKKELLQIRKAYPDTTIYTLTVQDNPRAMSAEQLAEKARSCGLRAEACKDFFEVQKKSHSGLTVVCGSLYLYRDLKLQESEL